MALLSLVEVITAIREEGIEIQQTEVEGFIQQSWVIPLHEEGGYFFDEADKARIELICELRRDMAINDEAVPVILNLLDQLYGLRRTLGEIREAVRELPPDWRAAFEKRLTESLGE
ncbi:chaperone modulatory protein CbpM [Tistlia consotensis]|uniref:Chaperone modulatory protein CbpM n=1 Tax=Tistlia consotensis USBA 355 TaxID=560819 RepID=A0A1Y6CL61_9PROT|nr:chaperone modulator CbpM [Tistlia consotensis]SMF60783.1 chaperone modulatory protein CbpM [Tistlia consotensis USBA 355]SNR92729.1 chaperone modulatory protein CbpM [Tistlia consotensis]